MTVSLNTAVHTWTGLSTDTKPTPTTTTTAWGAQVRVGDKFKESDTSDVYFWDGTAWTFDAMATGNTISAIGTNSRAAATLAAGATFQGVGEDVSKHGRVGVSIVSDNATDGTLTMEVSRDNIKWGGPTRTWTDTTIAVPHMWNIVEKYFRIKYVNGTTEATNLSIQTQYSNNADIALAHPLNDIIQGDEDVQLVRSASVVHLDISREHVKSQGTDLIFGFNADVGTSWEDIWPQGGDIAWQTTASVMGISSSSAVDTLLGAGARQLEIHGLSATGVDQKETLDMSGTTEVDTALTYIRITKMHLENVGTYGGSHQGDITARVGSSGAKSGAILAVMTGQEGSVDTSVQYGSGEINAGHWTVPLDKVAYLIGGTVIVNTTASKTADVVLYERENLLDATAPYGPRRELWGATETQGIVPIELKHFQKIKQLTDIWFRAQASNAGTKISVELYFYVLDNNSEGA